MYDRWQSVPETLQWWHCLSPEAKRKVEQWIRKNPPPEDWQGSDLDWAYTEMPSLLGFGF